MDSNWNLIIDFDSTFVKVETLDELANLTLDGNPDKEIILNQIKQITKDGMEGKITFDQSLQKRLTLFKCNKSQIKKVTNYIKSQITDSFIKNKSFIKTNSQSVYIISGGFKEIIAPIVQEFGISKNQILANDFLFEKESVIGVNTKNPLSQHLGKVKAVKQLTLKGKVVILGDGMTDYQIKKLGAADLFIAFTENIYRESVCINSDYQAKDFNQVIKYLNSV